MWNRCVQNSGGGTTQLEFELLGDGTSHTLNRDYKSIIVVTQPWGTNVPNCTLNGQNVPLYFNVGTTIYVIKIDNAKQGDVIALTGVNSNNFIGIN